MTTCIKLYSPELRGHQNQVNGLIVGIYQPDAVKSEQGLITTTDGRSFKAKLIKRAKVQYYQGLDLSKPMLFAVCPKPNFGVGFILSVVKITHLNNHQSNHLPNFFSIAESRLTKFFGLYWFRQHFLSLFD